jgi:cold shock CspA family protein
VSTGEPERGVVVRCRPYEQWGWIKPVDALLSDNTRDVFFHASCVRGSRPLGEEETVLYGVAITEDGRTRAVDVRRVELRNPSERCGKQVE